MVSTGGAEENRTPDLSIANATLSRLSYRPTLPANKYIGTRTTLFIYRQGLEQLINVLSQDSQPHPDPAFLNWISPTASASYVSALDDVSDD